MTPTLRRAALFVKRLVGGLARPMKHPQGSSGLTVTPYRGYGSRREAFLTGRVFRQVPLGRGVPGRGFLRDLLDVARRIARRGVAEAGVEIRLGDNHVAVTTDPDGYFEARLPLASSLPRDRVWHLAELWVTAAEEGPVRASVEVFIPASEPDLLVISDIDDTVMFTGVADRLRMLYRLFLERPDQRMAFPGVAALYQALHRGADDQGERPILYVSRGPWLIYEMLETFFQLNRIPVGPILFLREWGVSLRHPWPRRAEEHKEQLIGRMLATFEGVPCLLIGDSGQHDPEVYTRIVQAHPGRVQAIYIRRVENREDRQRAIQALRDQLRHTRCDLVLAADSVLIAEHAQASGFISDYGLEAVRREAATAAEDNGPEEAGPGDVA
ncbi:App1 family protein [Halomonas denitrificans]|uniref:App1 family protein n=1 Tax=Halomonas denitrificans TaxID=370769 RepID=UPI001FEA8436|nr:phosphatase domain-containing protein [Halomonas denitrificans]